MRKIEAARELEERIDTVVAGLPVDQLQVVLVTERTILDCRDSTSTSSSASCHDRSCTSAVRVITPSVSKIAASSAGPSPQVHAVAGTGAQSEVAAPAYRAAGELLDHDAHPLVAEVGACPRADRKLLESVDLVVVEHLVGDALGQDAPADVVVRVPRVDLERDGVLHHGRRELRPGSGPEHDSSGRPSCSSPAAPPETPRP